MFSSIAISNSKIQVYRQAVCLFFIIICMSPCRLAFTHDNTTNKQTLTEPPIALTKLLDRLNWQPARQGVLLIVDPDRIILPNERVVPITGNNKYTIRDLVSIFDLKLIKCGSLSVLTTKNMRVLADNLSKPDPYLFVDPSEALRFLLASLTEEQWAFIGASTGLGPEQLSSEQREIFSLIIPQPFVYHTISDRQYESGNSPLPVQLDETSRGKIRLRLNLKAKMALPLRDDAHAFWGFFDGSEQRNQRISRVIPVKQNLIRSQMFYKFIPSAEKPSDIVYSDTSLDETLALKPNTSVEEIIHQISLQTHRNIYADKRIANLPIRIYGDNARANDLLRAVSLALHGTFRKVRSDDGKEVLFILTEDLKGIGTRQAAIIDWIKESKVLLSDQRRLVLGTIRQQRPTKFIHFDSQNGLSLDLKSVEEFRGKETIPVAVLPDVFRSAIEYQADRASQQGKFVKSDKVRLDISVERSFVLADGTVIESPNLFGDSIYALDGPTNVPVSAKNGPADRKQTPARFSANRPHILRVAVDDIALIPSLLSIRSRYNFDQVWLDAGHVPLPELKAMIEQFNRRGIPVGVVFSLLTLDNSTMTPAVTKDVNVFGETTGEYIARRRKSLTMTSSVLFDKAANRDWLAADERAISNLKKSLAFISSGTKISGIIIKDTAPPGCLVIDARKQTDDTLFERDSTVLRHGEGFDLGYTNSLRMSYIKAEGVDPIDIERGDTTLSNQDFSSPFLQEHYAQETKPNIGYRNWSKFRYQANLRIMHDLFDFLQKDYPAMPIWLNSRSSDIQERLSWYSLWTSAESLPEYSDESISLDDLLRKNGSSGSSVSVPIIASGNDPGEDIMDIFAIEHQYGVLISSGRLNADAIIIDLSNRQFREYLAAIK